MKRIFLILSILCISIFSFAQDSWVDAGGSTWTATASQVQLEIRVIQNDVHDRTVQAFRVTIASQTFNYIVDSILNPVTTYITASQVTDLKVVTLPDGTTVYITESQLKLLKEDTTAYIKNFPTDYPDATAQSSLSSIETNTDNTYNQLKTSVTTSDVRYSGKVSTGTDGKVFASGNISPDDEVAFISFYTEGGNAQVTCTFRSGIIYVREGIPAGISVPIPVDNPTLQCTLDSDTTLYYISDEVD